MKRYLNMSGKRIKRHYYCLELDKTVFRANHRSNPTPLEGRFPHNKNDLLELLDSQLQSNIFDKNGPGMTPMFL